MKGILVYTKKLLKFRIFLNSMMLKIYQVKKRKGVLGRLQSLLNNSVLAHPIFRVIS